MLQITAKTRSLMVYTSYQTYFVLNILSFQNFAIINQANYINTTVLLFIFLDLLSLVPCSFI